MSRVGPRDAVVAPLRGRRSLADLLWVANTRHGPGGHWFARPTAGDPDHDHLLDADDATRYLADHRVSVPAAPPNAADLQDLGAIRDMVRALPDGGEWTDAVLAIRARTRYRVAADGELEADGAGWRGFIGDLLLPLLEGIRSKERLRACGNPACRLMFLDESRNRTRRWCDDGGCGNRSRVRRARRRASGSAET